MHRPTGRQRPRPTREQRRRRRPPTRGGTTTDDAASAEAGHDAASMADAPAHRSRFYLRGRRLRLPRSRGGLFALLLVLAGMGGVATFSAVSLLHWTETADFCGRCHAMEPELAAYEAGPHRDVACAECHVEPGIAGWIKAKLNGTRQLVEVVLGTFPEPIPPPDHSELPAASDTCASCHSVEPRSARIAQDPDPVRRGRGEHPPAGRSPDPSRRRRRVQRGPQRPLARASERHLRERRPARDNDRLRRGDDRGRHGGRVHLAGQDQGQPRTSSRTSMRSRPPSG